MNKKIIMIITIFLMIFSSCLQNDEDYSNKDFPIEIKVDPVVELFCIIHRLAETEQYNTNKFPKYINDIEDRFGKYKNHKAISLAIQQKNINRINGSAPMSLAVYLNSLPTLKPKNSLSSPPEGLDHRWTEKLANEFIVAAKSFSSTTSFIQFYNNNQELYERSINNLYSHIKRDSILEWFEMYFGYQLGKYTIVLGMQNGRGNYGLTVTHKDGTKEYIAIIGASTQFWRNTPTFSNRWITPTIVHEFCHSYINPLIDINYETLKESAEKIFDKEPPDNYYLPNIMMYEYLVRACTIRYFYSKNDQKSVNRRIKIDKKEGFPAIEDLVELLDKYETNRSRYEKFIDFMPEIQLFFNSYAKQME